MPAPSPEYGYSKDLGRVEFGEAIRRTTEALKTEGFGVLTSIDVKETLKQKLNVDRARYTILGACNPPLAHQALEADPGVGLLLPCNVTVFENSDGTVTVQAIKPAAMFQVVKTPAVKPVVDDADARIRRALERL